MPVLNDINSRAELAGDVIDSCYQYVAREQQIAAHLYGKESDQAKALGAFARELREDGEKIGRLDESAMDRAMGPHFQRVEQMKRTQSPLEQEKRLAALIQNTTL